MFYDAIENQHGLPHDPLKAIVAPRPIGWISTVDRQGRPNLAPYSFFSLVSEGPAIVAFSSVGWKDTAANLEATGECVCNLATFDLMNAVNETSAPLPPGESEFARAGLTPVPSTLVAPPRVGESPAALECKLLRIQPLTDLSGRKLGRYLALAQVIGIHIDDAALVDGHFDLTKVKPLSRLGYMDFGVTDQVFPLKRPKV
ncbi:flavin reductase family protein [Segnochrobactraceae bacterium EtOH-i3]